MSWISSALNKVFGSHQNAGRLLIKLAKEMLTVLVGKIAQDLQSIAVEEVIKAEASGKDGKAKFKMAFDAITKRLKTEVKASVISLAIETAVAAISMRGK